jgi:hypothetical protein
MIRAFRIGDLVRTALLLSPAIVMVGAVFAQTAAPPPPATVTSGELAAPEARNEQLRSLIPSQSHAMMDVAYHFTNLWFAGQHENWPLAQFYFNEARNHILWAIRLVPVRKTRAGEVNLQDLFAGFDGTLLTALKNEIAQRNRARFSAAYRQALTGCNACHAASEKPYLHVTVPRHPEVQIIDFTPRAEDSH